MEVLISLGKKIIDSLVGKTKKRHESNFGIINALLKGLKYSTELDLSDNQLTDITLLQELKNLTGSS